MKFIKKVTLIIFLIKVTIWTSVFSQSYKWRDVVALTDALYFEGAVNESPLGLWAIASNIQNRLESKDFPNSTYEVVYKDSRGRHNGGCQYSFTCDGLPEKARLFEALPARKAEMKRYWGESYPYEKRWLFYFGVSSVFLAGGHLLYDPTNNASHYWTGQKPYWAGPDCLKDSYKKIGSHTFCRSRYLGDDL